ncbi:MAG: peptidoglycan DD-metalloendopeptidase family protein [Leucobacter sp.]
MRKRTAAVVRRTIGVLGISILLAGGLVVGNTSSTPAQALDLPTWDDVQEAKKNQATASKKVTEIEGLLAEGEKELERLRNTHSVVVGEMQQAQAEFETAAQKAATLEKQAAASRKEADAAAERAGAIVAQMYRSGGVDRSMELFLDSDGETADALLERLASMSKATERNTHLSEEAEQAANTADTLGKQAEAVATERDRLQQIAQEKEQAAAAAVATQGDKVIAQEEQQRELSAQLAALKDTTAKTVEGYEERLRIEEERRRKEEERRRREAEEAARRAAEEAARQQAEWEQQQAELARQQQQEGLGGDNTAVDGNSGGGGGGGNSDGGGGGGGSSDGGGGGGGSTSAPPPVSSNTGWTMPTDGWLSEGFRPPSRPDHTGLDLAASCGTPIVAASSGTVAFAGWMDSMGGNMVYLNQDNGYQTRYAHMNGWPVVSAGQQVYGGQVIGYVGETGMAFGCHLHFEVRPGYDMNWDYNFLDPYPFIF